ncbi:MAG TPA: extracellular solute-binding protein, partial [Actinomycetes bacterium]|nr:extracellular solute-binding protein [Actinomycetes bacterium]
MMRARVQRTLVAVAVVPLLGGLVVGCQSSDGATDTTLTILAASSLTESFDDLAATFEDQHPGTKVEISYGSSATLAAQVVEGAPADIIATASPSSMQVVVDASSNAKPPVAFAINSV